MIIEGLLLSITESLLTTTSSESPVSTTIKGSLFSWIASSYGGCTSTCIIVDASFPLNANIRTTIKINRAKIIPRPTFIGFDIVDKVYLFSLSTCLLLFLVSPFSVSFVANFFVVNGDF